MIMKSVCKMFYQDFKVFNLLLDLCCCQLQGESVLAVLLPGHSYQDFKFFSLLLAHGSSKNIRPSNDPLHARDQPNIDCWPIGSAKNIRPSSDPLHARDQPNIDCWPIGPAKVCRPRNEATVKRLNNYKECLQDDLPRL